MTDSTNPVTLDTLTLSFSDLSVAWNDLPEATKVYLAGYGYSQSLADAAALSKSAKLRDTGEKDENGAAVFVPMTEAEVADLQHAKRVARFQSLIAGTMGERAVRAPVDPIAKLMRSIAVARVSAGLAKANLKLPRAGRTVAIAGVEYTRDELIERQLAKFDSEIRAEAERQLAETGPNVDVSDLV